mmetsp:Transcript_47665/g.152221  ORF Transcript_47665/g.152221 Transcript_47665/m.152221 type:complete len:216 (-) Transcript_47665:126-773(-)
MDDDDEEEIALVVPRGFQDGSGGSFHSGMPKLELLRGVVVRLYYSRATAALYLATLLLSGVLLAITLGMDTPLRDAPQALLWLEGLVSMSLFSEVALRAVVLGGVYLRSCSNILDSIVAIASASLMFWAAPRASRTKDFEAQKEDVELSQSLVMARTMVQLGRVLLIANHAHRSSQANSTDDISFSKLLSGSDFDFAVLRQRELQELHRSEDFGL